jgi:HSP20 family protein
MMVATRWIHFCAHALEKTAFMARLLYASRLSWLSHEPAFARPGDVVMATIAIHKEPSEKAARLREWEPLRAMRELMHWDPFAQMHPVLPMEEGLAFSPDFEVKDTKEAFVFKADMPGVKPNELDVKLEQNRLTVSGKRTAERSEKGESFYVCERSYGSFMRSFTLPDGVDADKTSADLRDGVLSIVIPKKPEAQPRKIDVSARSS